MATNNMINTPEPFSLASGGTGASLSAVQGGIAYSGASAMAFTAAGTTGQILESQGTGTPIWVTIPGLLGTWTTVTAGTLAAAINNGYVLNHASTACVVTLPATAAIGSKIAFRGLQGSGGWTITANTSQTIQFGNAVSSSAGSWSSTDPGDDCDVECVVANSVWKLTNCVSKGLTVV
jgi:hypothetical protein